MLEQRDGTSTLFVQPIVTRFISLFIFIRLPRRRRRRPGRRCHRFVLKRLLASVATVCLEVRRSAVKHHSSSWRIAAPFSVTSKVIETKNSKLIRSWRRQLEIVTLPFFVTIAYATRERKVERSLRGTQDYV